MKYSDITIGTKLKSLKIEDIGDNKILIAEIKDINGHSYIVLDKSKNSEFNIGQSRELIISIINRLHRLIIVDSDYVLNYDGIQENCFDNLQSLLEEQLRYYK